MNLLNNTFKECARKQTQLTSNQIYNAKARYSEVSVCHTYPVYKRKLIDIPAQKEVVRFALRQGASAVVCPAVASEYNFEHGRTEDPSRIGCFEAMDGANHWWRQAHRLLRR